MVADALPIVLVHGAWGGAWSWGGLQHALDRRGLASYAIDLPGRGTSTTPPSGLDGDIAAVIAAVRALDRPVTLVSHSYGGAVANGAAAAEPLVASVVHIAAFALDRRRERDGLPPLGAAPPGRAQRSDATAPRRFDHARPRSRRRAVRRVALRRRGAGATSPASASSRPGRSPVPCRATRSAGCPRATCSASATTPSTPSTSGSSPHGATGRSRSTATTSRCCTAPTCSPSVLDGLVARPGSATA